ncbi:MAG: WG repeat-containing protein, partial [Bacteroidota bacterium]
MVKHLVQIGIILFFSTSLVAQQFNGSNELVYPIRQNHKTGYIYIKKYGSIDCISPKYDYIAEDRSPWNTTQSQLDYSPYQLFIVDEKIGLIDTVLNEVIAPKYKRIRPLAKDYFAVEVDSGFMLIDVNEAIILSQRFQNICSAQKPEENNIDLLFVQQDNRWGLYRKDGNILLDFRYADIQRSGTPGFYKVKRKFSDSKWQLIDSSGNIVIKERYSDFKVLDKNLIAVKEGSWSLYSRNPEQPHSPLLISRKKRYQKIKKLNGQLAYFLPYHGGELPASELWDISSQKILKEFPTKEISEGTFRPTFNHLSDQYTQQISGVLLDGKTDYKKCLINNNGDRVSPFFEDIEQTNRKYIFKGVSRSTQE